MQAEIYLKHLAEKLESYFDIEREKMIGEIKIDLFGRCHIKHVRTFLTPKDVVDSYESNEYFVVKVFEELTEEGLSSFEKFLRQVVMKSYVVPKEDHMCTVINGVAVIEKNLSEDVERKIKGYFYEKSFLFSLKGWSRINLAAVDLEKGRLVLSKKGRELEKILKP
ncbi:MAG: hypothetical protein PWP45_1503 [Tepidanaerobacteraceae bacterium]|nr:hypothetical protein [Tepidanaerobacteraceae bacterium]